MLNLLANRYITSSAWGKVKEPLQNSFPDSHDHPVEPNTKEDKHKIKKVHDIPVPKKLRSKRMNSDNLQAITHTMGIDHTKVKAKVTWYLFSYAHKTTISMKRYTRSYDLSIKPMRISLISICLNLINPLIALEHG